MFVSLLHNEQREAYEVSYCGPATIQQCYSLPAGPWSPIGTARPLAQGHGHVNYQKATPTCRALSGVVPLLPGLTCGPCGQCKHLGTSLMLFDHRTGLCSTPTTLETVL